MNNKKENLNIKSENSNNKTLYTFHIAIIVVLILDLLLLLLGFGASPVLAISAVSVFIVIGIWCIFDYPKSLRKKKEGCTQAVSSTIVDCIVNSSDDSKSYYAIYEYTYNNYTYRSNTKEDYGRKPKIGMDAKLLINPDNPSEIYEIEREESRIRSMCVVGIIMIVMALSTVNSEVIPMFRQLIR